MYDPFALVNLKVDWYFGSGSPQNVYYVLTIHTFTLLSLFYGKVYISELKRIKMYF